MTGGFSKKPRNTEERSWIFNYHRKIISTTIKEIYAASK